MCGAGEHLERGNVGVGDRLAPARGGEEERGSMNCIQMLWGDLTICDTAHPAPHPPWHLGKQLEGGTRGENMRI